MNYNLTALIIALIIFIEPIFSQEKITIEAQLPAGMDTGSIELQFSPLYFVGNSPEWKSVFQKIDKGRIKWTLSSDKRLLIYSAPVLGKRYSYVVEPGDSIKITYNGENPVFSGKGYEKLEMQQILVLLKNSIKKPQNQVAYTINSLQDYFDWNLYLNKQLDVIISGMDRFKDKVSLLIYEYIKAAIVSDIELERMHKFWALRSNGEKFGLTNQDLCNIFDSTANSKAAKWLRSFSGMVNNVGYFYVFNRAETFRVHDFNINNDSLISEAKRKLLYYNLASTKYKGLVREKLLAYLVTSQAMKEVGFVPETEIILSSYYNQISYPEYKEWVRSYELKARTLKKGMPAPDFSLVDINGNVFTKERLNGKVILMDFWFTGCVGCAQITPILNKLETIYKNDTTVVFLSVCTDKEKTTWTKSIAQKKYTTENSINLYTSGSGNAHSIIKTYNISSFPTLFLIDRNGIIVDNPIPDPRHDDGEFLKDMIDQQLAYMNDGPYIIYKDDTATIYSIDRSVVRFEKQTKTSLKTIKAQVNRRGKSIDIALKSEMFVEPSEFIRPEKIFVLSDIEGNLEAFRKLLLAGGIIDETHNWIFGKGHLVLNGDFFDRGQQVTECLWLIYSLEKKAQAAGGYVHFILGNHEIMNLSGNIKYVHQKYKDNFKNFNLDNEIVWSEKSELGQWLRTKNIVERIGELLFVHGGVATEINSLSLPIMEMNRLAREGYSKPNVAPNTLLTTFLNVNTSPYWYRGYYETYNGLPKASGLLVDSTLQKFAVSTIITGHTIVGDTISIHYNGKVVNTDTPHAKGKSEALLIDGINYYRVDAEGKRSLLIKGKRNYSDITGI